MRSPGNAGPAWPSRLAALQAELLDAPGGAARQTLRASLWRLLVEALTRFVATQASRANRRGHPEVEDIAAEKALELLARAESGAWDLSGRSPGEIVRYLERAALHGWLDHVSRERRETPEGWRGGPHEDTEAPAEWQDSSEDDPVSGRAESGELATALVDCVGRLALRDRRVWFFRAYYEMNSREIASHPSVSLRPAHVDVINQRCRDALRQCMRDKGHDLLEMPRECFVRLWEALENLAGITELHVEGPPGDGGGRR